MKKGGMLIRLIDVVLILLFGFISISEISEKTLIELPASTEIPPSLPDKEEIVIVGVAMNGIYLLENETVHISAPQDLLSYLQAEKATALASGTNLRVRVRPHRDTPIKYTMRVAAICDQLNIAKGMDVRRVQ